NQSSCCVPAVHTFKKVHTVLTQVKTKRLLAARLVSPRQYAPVAALITALFITTAARSQSCTPDFLITPTPNGSANRLKGVAAFDVNDVWAVAFTNANNDQTLTEHWDGSSWTIIPSANQEAFSQLSAVGGIATNDLWAVGPATVRTVRRNIAIYTH